MEVYNFVNELPNWIPQWVKLDERIKKYCGKKKISNIINDGHLSIDLKLKKTGSISKARSLLLDMERDVIILSNYDDGGTYQNRLAKIVEQDVIREKGFLNSFNITQVDSYLLSQSVTLLIEYICEYSSSKKQEYSEPTVWYDEKTGKKTKRLKNPISKIPNFSLNDFKKNVKRYFEELNKSKENDTQVLGAVFSSNPIEVLSMSSRSEWFSCQELFNGQAKEMAINSALNDYVGIVYLTNYKKYLDRANTIIARCLVFYVENDQGDGIIVIGPVYTSEQYYHHYLEFFNIFKNFISSLTGRQIYTCGEYSNGYVLPDKSILNSKSMPYLDRIMLDICPIDKNVLNLDTYNLSEEGVLDLFNNIERHNVAYAANKYIIENDCTDDFLKKIIQLLDFQGYEFLFNCNYKICDRVINSDSFRKWLIEQANHDVEKLSLLKRVCSGEYDSHDAWLQD